jgi:hypothetical protein
MPFFLDLSPKSIENFHANEYSGGTGLLGPWRRCGRRERVAGARGWPKQLWLSIFNAFRTALHACVDVLQGLLEDLETGLPHTHVDWARYILKYVTWKVRRMVIANLRVICTPRFGGRESGHRAIYQTVGRAVSGHRAELQTKPEASDAILRLSARNPLVEGHALIKKRPSCPMVAC